MNKIVGKTKFSQYSVPEQVFDAFNKEIPIQEALGTKRAKSILEASEIRSVNWVEGVSGWRLTPRGLELGNSSGVFPPGTVTFTDIQNIATDKLLGRDTAGSGVIEQLGLGAGLSISGGNLVVTVSQFTDEQAQDAVGAMVDTSLVYVDATPLLTRAALTGAITASQGSNATVLGSFTKAQLDTAVSDGNVLYVGDVTQYTNELAQDAVGAMIGDTNTIEIIYTDGTPLLEANVLYQASGSITLSDDAGGLKAETIGDSGNFTTTDLKTVTVVDGLITSIV